MTMLNKPTRVYLSGAMSGMPDLNFPLFNKVAEQLRGLGWDVVNPVDINGDPSARWIDCIIADLRHVEKCDAIAMLPGWEKSFGAQIEHLTAQKLGLAVYNAADLVQMEAA
jgi:hypothetical protein